MRSTTVLSFLAASIAVLSPVYAAPVFTEAGSAVTKRCVGLGCKDAVVPTTTNDSTQPSDSTAQLVQALLDTLTSFQSGVPTSDPPSTGTKPALDAVEPNSATGPSDPAVIFGAL